MPDAESTLLTPAQIGACNARRGKLLLAMMAEGIDALLLTCEKDVHYLTGFVGHESLGMVVADAQDATGVIISDRRYDEYLEPWRRSMASDVIMGTRHRLNDAVNGICEQRGIKKLAVQADHITVAGRESLGKCVGESRLVNTVGLVGRLRMQKDPLEIELIERAVAVAQDAIGAALGRLSRGQSELQFSAILEYEMKSRGAHGSAFTPIIGAGANSSIIHHSTGAAPIEQGVLLVDWGAMIDGYNSDLTRTYFIGTAPPKLREVYKVVLDAQMAAIAAIAPGKVCAEIDAVARSIIDRAGYGKYFGHGLGHGLGMDVHEGPYFNNLQTDITLAPGMVMTVEPGIYLPGVGGVRIEDDVLITDCSHRVLSDLPKDFDSAVIEPAALMGTHS